MYEAKCETCDGWGYLEDANGNEGDCFSCAGTGQDDAEYEGGYGTVPAPSFGAFKSMWEPFIVMVLTFLFGLFVLWLERG